MHASCVKESLSSKMVCREHKLARAQEKCYVKISEQSSLARQRPWQKKTPLLEILRLTAAGKGGELGGSQTTTPIHWVASPNNTTQRAHPHTHLWFDSLITVTPTLPTQFPRFYLLMTASSFVILRSLSYLTGCLANKTSSRFVFF